MSPITITADGIEWPLETFIDAYGFTKLDWRTDAKALDTDLPLEVVIPDGPRLTVKEMIGRHVDRHAVVAIKGAGGCSMCDGCAMPFEPAAPIYASDVETRRRFIVNEVETIFCDECLMDEWSY